MIAFTMGMALRGASSWDGVLCAVGAGAIILSVVRLEEAGRITTPRWLAWIGSASYSVYLVHFSVISMLATILGRVGAPMSESLCAACAVIGVVAGLLFDRVIDQPIQGWLRKRKRRVVPSAPA